MFKFSATIIGVVLVFSVDSSAADESSTTYYLGESKMTTPDGRLLRTSVSLVKRVVKPKESKIEEHVLSVDERSAKPFVVTQKVSGSKFTMTEKSDSFGGEGDLIGEPWKWTGWKSVSKIAGGAGTVTSEDKLSEHGLTVKKTFAGPDGKASVKFEKSLKPVSAKMYEISVLAADGG